LDHIIVTTRKLNHDKLTKILSLNLALLKLCTREYEIHVLIYYWINVELEKNKKQDV